MVNLDGHSRGRQRLSGAGSRHLGKISSRNKVLHVFVLLVVTCCAFNLILHYKATAGVAEKWSEFSVSGVSDTSDDSVDISRARARARDAKTEVPTWRPTKATAQKQSTSWAPTHEVTTIYPTKSTNEKIHSEEHGYDNERSMAHPKVACFFNGVLHHDNDSVPNKNERKGTSCGSLDTRPILKKKPRPIESIPLETNSHKGGKVEEEVDVNEYGETDTCKYPDPSHQPTSTAPPTCNDIHSLGFDYGMFENQHRQTHRESTEYITMGGAKCVWKVTTEYEQYEKETFIFKSHKDSRFLKRMFWDQNLLDALICGGGNAQLSSMNESPKDISGIDSNWNHILPIYHYCALSNVVPYAADGTLMEYMNKHEKDKKGRRMEPIDTLRLALQAARGLYQAQLYRDGKPTYVHADLNPSQYLVFMPKKSKVGDNKKTARNQLPIIQINDFNQGRFLTRSVENNEVCPFRVCTKNLRGNRWHTPERFVECVNQDHRIDTFSLGDVFFVLLTNGFEPYYDARNYMKSIKEGQLPNIPKELDLDHPAYDALKGVMEKCMAFKLEDRPSSLEVVQMLEEKLSQIETTHQVSQK